MRSTLTLSLAIMITVMMWSARQIDAPLVPAPPTLLLTICFAVACWRHRLLYETRGRREAGEGVGHG